MRSPLRVAVSVVACALLATATASLRASAEAQEPPGDTEVVIVTGSHIPRESFSGAAPVQTIDAVEIAQSGVNSVSELVARLSANVGSEWNANAFTQNATFGSAQLNLRGLGLGATLVLLNGRRMNVAGITADDGSAFVDINLVPLSAIERVEILLDGASAIYGSDAVAGVVNLITRSDYDGFEVGGSFQRTTQDDQQDRAAHALFGRAGDDGRVMLTFSYLERTPLRNVDRSFTKRRVRVFSGPPGPGQVSARRLLSASPAGQPATYLDLISGLPAPDPDCGAAGTSSELDPLFLADQAAGGANLVAPACLFNFDAFELVAREERFNVYGSATYDFSDTLAFDGEFMFARNQAERRASPSFPMAVEFPIVGSAHPDNPFGSEVLMIGRALGQPAGAETNKNRTNHFRAVGRLGGDMADLLGGLGSFFDRTAAEELAEWASLDEWEWEATGVWSLSDQIFEANDTAREPFLRALNGCGGPAGILATAGGGVPGPAGCDTSAASYFSPATTFNPFASAYLGTGTPNSAAVVDSFIAKITTNTVSELVTLDGLLRGPLPLELWAGEPISLALGVQGRREDLEVDFDAISNEDGFLFALGAPDSAARRWTLALFAESLLPVTRGVELVAAVRWEDVEGVGNRASPQVRGQLRPFDNRWLEGPEWLRGLSLQASFNASFRAPALSQTSTFQTRLVQLSDPLGGPPSFRPVRTQGNPDLDPETSKSWSAGFHWDPLPGLSFGLNWWSYRFEDLVVQPSAQGFVNANPLALCAAPAVPPCLQRDPLSGAIQLVLIEFQNASEVETDGFDLDLEYVFELADWGIAMDAGRFRFASRTTYMNRYEISGFEGLRRFDAAGSRNAQNFARSLPQWRANFVLDWLLGDHALAAIVRVTGSYDDDEDFNGDGANCQAPRGGFDQTGAPIARATSRCFRNVEEFVTLDLQYSYHWDRFGAGTTLTLGLLNVTDEEPPFVQTVPGYDAVLADPRGRMFYLKLGQAW